ncbi:MAG: hypothetical protein HY974_02440, partial [Candidatus Kerfeldbacteria bacterium]|nr:hypothetical protein [Candidatus Kerfeldbacteria bacterium]
MAAEVEVVKAAVGLDASVIKGIAAGATIAIGGMVPALAIGKLAGKAMEAIGRNPEASAKVQTAM